MTDPALGDPTPTPKKRRQWPWLVGSALVAGIAIVAGLGKGEPSDNERMVTLCQKVVTDDAVAPSTVTFVSSQVVADADGGWTVSGELDGQNVFGAMLRSPYACKLTYHEDRGLFSARITG
ncbi:hypothetical protein [Rhodococcus rhodochrous]|uniref:hypothetical protein n=1 Tax=Rhodococcus rhodochrous TaxID=1829 RepID=UPI00177D0681|nr:hypothetical protein [Rhodococcus rhodochrous]QOH59910.1 hypothetical protein C6Y44_27870 [Rhodococcus rhodochrous]